MCYEMHRYRCGHMSSSRIRCRNNRQSTGKRFMAALIPALGCKERRSTLKHFDYECHVCRDKPPEQWQLNKDIDPSTSTLSTQMPASGGEQTVLRSHHNARARRNISNSAIANSPSIGPVRPLRLVPGLNIQDAVDPVYGQREYTPYRRATPWMEEGLSASRPRSPTTPQAAQNTIRPTPSYPTSLNQAYYTPCSSLSIADSEDLLVPVTRPSLSQKSSWTGRSVRSGREAMGRLRQTFKSTYTLRENCSAESFTCVTSQRVERGN